MPFITEADRRSKAQTRAGRREAGCSRPELVFLVVHLSELRLVCSILSSFLLKSPSAKSSCVGAPPPHPSHGPPASRALSQNQRPPGSWLVGTCGFGEPGLGRPLLPPSPAWVHCERTAAALTARRAFFHLRHRWGDPAPLLVLICCWVPATPGTHLPLVSGVGSGAASERQHTCASSPSPTLSFSGLGPKDMLLTEFEIHNALLGFSPCLFPSRLYIWVRTELQGPQSRKLSAPLPGLFTLLFHFRSCSVYCDSLLSHLEPLR